MHRRQRQALPARLSATELVADNVMEMRLAVPALANTRIAPGAHTVVHVEPSKTRRVYSIWQRTIDPSEIVLRIVIHNLQTPGCSWATKAKPGDDVTIEFPRSKIALDGDADVHVFLGDETGAIPLLAMRRALYIRQPTSRTLTCFTTKSEGCEIPSDHEAHWVYRQVASPVASRTLLQAVQKLDGLNEPQNKVAYIAGETATCALVRRFLIHEMRWTPTSIKVQQQWAPNRPGFGTGVPRRVVPES